jgi:acyl-CoA synthetase (AMP-forming)/AMP-acid ligase II
MTEAAHQMTANFLPPGQRKPGSVGKGRGVDICIMTEKGAVLPFGKVGEVCIHGKNVIKGNKSH